MSDEIKKVKFEVKEHYDNVRGITCRDIFLDEALFSYEIDQETLARAKSMGPKFYLVTQAEIQKHFLDSLSSELSRAVTQEEVMEAVKTGYI